MKSPTILISAVAGLLVGCSGVFPSVGAGPVVAPAELDQFTRGGSMSTLWYLGSDARYHHFTHLFKVSTRYRVQRDDLKWEPEFPLNSQDSVLVGPGIQAAQWRLERSAED